MTNVNKVILIGNLGRRVIQSDLKDAGLKDAYGDLRAAADEFLHILCRKVDPVFREELGTSPSLKEIAKALCIALARWRAAFAMFQSKVKATSLPRLTSATRTSSFFNAAKVDGRNLP